MKKFLFWGNLPVVLFFKKIDWTKKKKKKLMKKEKGKLIIHFLNVFLKLFYCDHKFIFINQTKKYSMERNTWKIKWQLLLFFFFLRLSLKIQLFYLKMWTFSLVALLMKLLITINILNSKHNFEDKKEAFISSVFITHNSILIENAFDVQQPMTTVIVNNNYWQ